MHTKIVPQTLEINSPEDIGNEKILSPKNFSSIEEIQEYLKTLKNEFLKEAPKKNSYQIFLYEYDEYKRNEDKMRFSDFKNKIKSQIEDFRSLSIRGLRLSNIEVPILNYFAYFYDLETLQFLFEMFQEQELEIFPDFRNFDVLEIAIEQKNLTLIDLIINETTKNPPSYGCWKNLSKKTMIALFKMQVDNLGYFLDSRVFPLKISNHLRFSTNFLHSKSLVCDSLPLLDDDIRNYLIKLPKKNNKDSRTKLTEFYFLDIKNFVSDNDYCFQEINDYYSADNQIYASKVLSAMGYKHWFSYGFMGYLSKFVLIALELFFLFQFTDYIPSLPTEELKTKTGFTSILVLVIFGIIIFLELKTEILELKNSHLSIYLRTEQNIFDIITISLFIIMFVFLCIQYHNTVYDITFPDDFFDRKLFVQGIFYFMVALRILWMLQILPSFGFYLRMITYTIRYIFLFCWIFIGFIIIVCWSFAGVVGDVGLTTSASWSFGNFYRIYKAAFGDTQDFFEILDKETLRYSFSYVAFFIVSLVLQVILLNIVITLLAEGYGNLREYQDRFGLKAIIDANMGVKGTNKIKLVETKLHYKWYESVAFYVKFYVYNYFCGLILSREKFQGNFFVFSYISKNINKKEENLKERYYINSSNRTIINSLDDFEDKN